MNKVQILKAAKMLRQGGVIAHQTSTLAGIAASALCPTAIKRVQAFKQRSAPFYCLLIPSVPHYNKRYIFPKI
ncbi:MAG: Sua5/YciO/YrdC/YwlC family protein [Ghiorsea sp.]|nr:Sua5/YciO/YrdC/YwlC family protein [Ghiorsea sp.]